MWTDSAFISAAANIAGNIGIVTLRIHHILVRKKHHVHARVFKFFEILLLLTWVRCKIFVWGKLLRINEDA